MAIIGFLLLGLVAGAIARFLVPGRDPMGWVGTLVLGCVGSLLGGFLAKALFNDSDGVGLIGSVIGAVIALLVYNAVTRRDRVGV
jgi:uncharacterized membrane protein YeaQ/YmgE (transglycosylase-associated protein family)